MYVTLHYNTLDYNILHYITLHYIISFYIILCILSISSILCIFCILPILSLLCILCNMYICDIYIYIVSIFSISCISLCMLVCNANILWKKHICQSYSHYCGNVFEISVYNIYIYIIYIYRYFKHIPTICLYIYTYSIYFMMTIHMYIYILFGRSWQVVTNLSISIAILNSYHPTTMDESRNISKSYVFLWLGT